MYINAFSLVELMVVIAIVVVLAAVATPFLSDYLVRAQVNEAVVLLQARATEAASFYETRNALPSDTDMPDIMNPTVRITEIAVENNGGANDTDVIKIHATFSSNADDDLAGKALFMEGAVINGSWQWLCRHSVGINVIDNKFLPGACQYSGSCPDMYCLDD